VGIIYTSEVGIGGNSYKLAKWFSTQKKWKSSFISWGN